LALQSPEATGGLNLQITPFVLVVLVFLGGCFQSDCSQTHAAIRTNGLPIRIAGPLVNRFGKTVQFQMRGHDASDIGETDLA
jgi:hypothetical protein